MGELTQIIKLDATDSTNLYLKNLLSLTSLKDYTVVVTTNQRKGRGQMGTVWESEAGKNLTFSVLKCFESFEAERQFQINMAVSLGLYTALTELNIPSISVKWPNDIMSGSKKICGILIENILSGSGITKSIIGIGLNVNQNSFGKLSNASSFAMATGRTFDLDFVLQSVLNKLRTFLDPLETSKALSLKNNYESLLFRKDVVSTFKRKDETLFSGIIRGIAPSGQLMLEQEDTTLSFYSLKEVSLQI